MPQSSANKSLFLPQVFQPSSKSGFTLLEVLVMTGITVILLLSATAIFMTFLVNQSLITQKQKIKTQGDNALKQMTQVLREAREVVNCEEVAIDQEITYKDIANNEGSFFIEENRIASDSASSSDRVFLTADDLTVSEFSPSCTLGYESYLVKIKFTLEIETQSFADSPLKQTFEADVSLRN